MRPLHGKAGHELTAQGLQAARSADVAISQFRFLRKLLLVHGSWSYQRLSKLILCE
jgi:phospholipid-transporting ATPase